MTEAAMSDDDKVLIGLKGWFSGPLLFAILLALVVGSVGIFIASRNIVEELKNPLFLLFRGIDIWCLDRRHRQAADR